VIQPIRLRDMAISTNVACILCSVFVRTYADLSFR
jgi:hypothetical protein